MRLKTERRAPVESDEARRVKGIRFLCKLRPDKYQAAYKDARLFLWEKIGTKRIHFWVRTSL